MPRDAKKRTALLVSISVVLLTLIGSVVGLAVSMLAAGVGPVAASDYGWQASTEISGLGNPSREVSRNAARQLLQNDPDRLVALAVKGNAIERSRAIRALGWSKDPKYLDLYFDAAVDPDRYVRMAAIGAVGTLPPDKTLCDRMITLRQLERDESSRGIWDEVMQRVGCHVRH